MGRLATTAAVALALGTLLGASPARAQPWDDRPNLLPHTPHGVWGELSIYSRGADDPDPGATVVSPLLHGYFGIGRSFELGFSWGFGYHDQVDSEVVAGNPYLAGRWVWIERQHRIRVGGGLAAPLSSPDEDVGAAGLEGAVRGWWSPWLWAPDRLSFVLPELRWEFHAPVLYLAAEAALAAMIYTGGDEGDPEIAGQLGAEIGARIAEPFILGLRFQAVGFFTVDGDGGQVALAPFAQIEFGRAFVFTRVVLNVDPPLGFAADGPAWWAVQIGGGGRF